MYSTFEISKSGTDHFILGPVLVPDIIDRQGDSVSAEEIAKACAAYNDGPKFVYKDHDRPLDRSDAEIIESYVTPAVMEIGGAKVPAGSWIVKFKVSEDIYKMARRGAVRGFSVSGSSSVEGMQ